MSTATITVTVTVPATVFTQTFKIIDSHDLIFIIFINCGKHFRHSDPIVFAKKYCFWLVSYPFSLAICL